VIRRLTISVRLQERIAGEARAAFPRECCGLIEGVHEGDIVRALAVHPTRNLAEEADRFEIDPMEQFSLMRTARARGHEIVGCYHSHPNGRAGPSPRDAENGSEDGFVWLIAALSEAGGEVAIGAFEGTPFRALSLAPAEAPKV
jgi:desampylase